MEIDAYPLYWPEGEPRARTRAPSRFKVGFVTSRDELLHSLELLGAIEPIVSTNVPLRSDGLPRAEFKTPADPGVAVYFLWGKDPARRTQKVIACDNYQTVTANLRAVGATLEAMRTIERHGSTSMLERAFTGFMALPPKGGEVRSWWDVLGVSAEATP